MKNVILCVLGTLGFSVMLRAQKRRLIYVALGALISSLLFENLINVLGVFLSAFISTFSIGIYSEIIARVKKTPSTVILLPSTIPLLPGSALFYSMKGFIEKDFNSFLSFFLEAVETGLGIALGTILTYMLIISIRFIKNKFTS